MINIKEIEESLTPNTNRRVVNLLQSEKMIFYIYQLLVYYKLYLDSFESFKEYVFKKSIVKVLKELGLWRSDGNFRERQIFCDERIAALIVSNYYEYKGLDNDFKNLIDNLQVTKNQKNFNESLKKINANVFNVHMAINKSFGVESRILLDLKTINKINSFENEIINYIESGEVKTESEIIFLTHIILK